MIHKPVVKAWPVDFFYNISDMERKAGSIYLKRLRCVDDNPVMLETTYISNVNLPRFCSRSFVNGSLFETLNVEHEVEITHVEQDLRAVNADEETASFLKIQPESSLLHIYLKFYTNRPHLFIYSSLLCNTANYSIGNRL
jgi:GntR family transcriptional regulator/GntR family frlABCD operon transcriptional regulator